jgi:hypothetical protein
VRRIGRNNPGKMSFFERADQKCGLETFNL